MEKVYINIRNRRQELKMTQTELAEKVGYTSKSMIARIEAGLVDLPLPKVESIAKALNIEPSVLLGWDSEEKPHMELFKTNLYAFGSPEEEPEILTLFNSMNKEGQEMLLATARAFASQGIYKKPDTNEEIG